MVCVSAQSFWSLNIENCCIKIQNIFSGCDCGQKLWNLAVKISILSENVANRTVKNVWMFILNYEYKQFIQWLDIGKDKIIKIFIFQGIKRLANKSQIIQLRHFNE